MSLPVLHRFSLAVCAGLFCGTTAAPAEEPASPADPSAACVAEAHAAEVEAGLPSGLLLAIGLAESGRADPRTGAAHPWPWTVNASGAGRFFGSAQEAMDWVRERQAMGIASIDVGCFQINLLYHPEAFASLTEAFDPASNARAAARFLTELHGRTGDWPAAVGLYHSASPQFALPYRATVLNLWGLPPGLSGTAVPPRDDYIHAVRVIVPAWASAGPPPVSTRNGFAGGETVRPGLPPVFYPSAMAQVRP